MADYKDIAGTTVRGNAGVLTSAKTGELFYDSTNENFSYRFPNVTTAGSWRTGSNLNAARKEMGGAGIQTAALWHGGTGPGSPNTVATKQYNGSSWTEVGNLNTARTSHAGTGTVTAALAIANSPVAAIVEAYDGTSWTEVGDLNTARDSLGGVGTQTSSLVFGGNAPPVTVNTEAWDGTSWTEVNNLATARRLIGGTGTGSTSAQSCGGLPATATTEEWTFSHAIKTVTTS